MVAEHLVLKIVVWATGLSFIKVVNFGLGFEQMLQEFWSDTLPPFFLLYLFIWNNVSALTLKTTHQLQDLSDVQNASCLTVSNSEDFKYCYVCFCWIGDSVSLEFGMNLPFPIKPQKRWDYGGTPPLWISYMGSRDHSEACLLQALFPSEPFLQYKI